MANTTVGMTFEVYNRGSSGINAIAADLNRLRGTLTGFAGAVGIGLGLHAAIRQMGSWISAAKEAAGVQRVFELALGDNAEAAGRWADRYSKAAGVSAEGTRKLMTTAALTAEELGLTEDQTLRTAEALTRLANDTASFTRGAVTAPEAMQKFTLAMQGNYRGLSALNIKIDEATVKEYALRQGWMREGQELSRAQAAAAAFNLILDHTAKIQGDLERSAGDAADKERRLKEEWQDLKRELGETILPAYQQGLQELHKTLQEHKEDLRDIAEGITIAANAFLKAEGWLSSKTKAAIDYMAEPILEWNQTRQYYASANPADQAMSRISGKIPSWDQILGTPAQVRPYGPRMIGDYDIFDFQPYAGSPLLPGAANRTPYGPLLSASEYEKLQNPGGAVDTERRINQEISAYRQLYSQVARMTEESYQGRMQLLQEEYDRYARFVKDKNLLDQWYQEQARKLELERREASQDFFAGVSAGIMRMQDEMKTLGELGSESARMLRDGMADATTDALMNVQSLGAGLRAVAMDMIRMGLRQSMGALYTQMFSGVTSAFGGVAGGGTPGPGINAASNVGNFELGLGNARGNVFSYGRVVPFALGTIIHRPTLFPIAGGAVGLMGEDGEEAIMPLRRGPGGRLGVEAVGGGISTKRIEALLEQIAAKDMSVLVVLEGLEDKILATMGNRKGREKILETGQRYG